jgi:hypothetical protein
MQPPPDDQQTSPEAKDLVVFSILRESKCAECGKELLSGDLLFMEGERPLCLSCADLDQLVYLPRGDTALTRRARKIRHRHTKYDRLLMKGYERMDARDAVREEIDRVLESWRSAASSQRPV